MEEVFLLSILHFAIWLRMPWEGGYMGEPVMRKCLESVGIELGPLSDTSLSVMQCSAKQDFNFPRTLKLVLLLRQSNSKKLE